ncbi:MAG: hypothetical protein JXA54_03960 [Candidatus Heimdallarchaeota archaeon]|nr:hypothetical protein [Candidatus Heimdallarchaeota archaeon]
MSENIDCNLSMGVTESGKIGNDIMIGVLSVEKENELNLLVNNLLHSNHIVNLVGNPLNTNNKTNKIDKSIAKKYIANLIRNNKLKIAMFRLQPREQFRLLQEICILEGQKLYEIGKSLDTTNYQFVGKALQLRYQYPKLFVDTFIKTVVQYMALNWVSKETECGYAELFKQNIAEERKMAMHIIVNGGPQFSSYQDLLNDNLKNYWSDIKTAEGSTFYWNLMVATHGISNAKYFYPVVSSIDLITSEVNSNVEAYFHNGNILHDITSEDILSKKDLIGKSLLEVLHEQYLERTGSTFRPPKLWQIGNFSDLGEFGLTLPYLMLQKSIKEKKITAREVDDDVSNIERFYQYNNPLDRDAFIIGQVTDKDNEKITALKDLGIEGITIQESQIVEEYQTLLNDIANYIQCDDCIISNEDQKQILAKIANFEKEDFKKINKIKIPNSILD